MCSGFSLWTNHRLFSMTVALSISYSRCLIKMHSYICFSVFLGWHPCCKELLTHFLTFLVKIHLHRRPQDSPEAAFFFLFVGKISYKQVLVQVTEKRAESILREMKFIHTNVLKCSFWTVSLHLEMSKKPLSENFPGREILSPHFLVNITTVAAPSSSWITLKQSPQQSHRVLGIQWCPGHITLGCSTGITSW